MTVSNNTMSRKSIFYAAVGAGIEWFDFTAFIFVAGYISHLFFPSGDPSVALMSTFGVFAAGYIMRPIGGIFFGNLGDKIGRKKVIIIAMMCITVSIFIMAVLPTYDQIGITAVVVMLFARMLQGFSVGGEYNGVLVMLLEQAPDHRRGFVTSWGTMVSGTGTLVSSLVVMALVYMLSDEQMLAWGWRVPFIIGFFLSIGVLYLQFQMDDSPHFKEVENAHHVKQTPILTALRTHKKELIQVFCLTGFLGVAYYTAAAFLPAYLKEIIQIPYTHAMLITSVAAATYAFTAPFWGALSDRVGRKPILLISSILLAVLAYPLFWLLTLNSLMIMIAVGVVLMLIVSAATAVFVTTINEAFPTAIRFSAVGASYNVANAIFGGTTPLVATYLIYQTHSDIAPSFYLIFVSVASIGIILWMKETRWTELED